MPARTREWLEILARALYWAAVVVLILSIIGAVSIATGDQALFGLEQFEAQGRAALAIASLAGGIAAAGILAGLGGILTVLLYPGGPGSFDPDA